MQRQMTTYSFDDSLNYGLREMVSNYEGLLAMDRYSEVAKVTLLLHCLALVSSVNLKQS